MAEKMVSVVPFKMVICDSYILVYQRIKPPFSSGFSYDFPIVFNVGKRLATSDPQSSDFQLGPEDHPQGTSGKQPPRGLSLTASHKKWPWGHAELLGYGGCSRGPQQLEPACAVIVLG